MKRLFCLKANNGLGRIALSALPHYEEAFLPTGKNVVYEYKTNLYIYKVLNVKKTSNKKDRLRFTGKQ